MSGVFKFLKSLVSSEPAASKVITKAPDLARPAIVPETTTPITSQSIPSNLQTVKPHVPLIKFRKGGPAPSHTVLSGAPSPGSTSGHSTVSRSTIEDYQLPPRYHRTPIDEKEIEYINRGGPE